MTHRRLSLDLSLLLMLTFSTGLTAERDTSNKWIYKGCHLAKSKSSAHALLTNVTAKLTGPDGASLYLDHTECAMACLLFDKKQLRHFGLANGMECWCGDSIQLNRLENSSQCSLRCPANREQMCGGPNAMDIYAMTTAVKPRIPARAVGCYLHNIKWHPVLQNKEFVSNSTFVSHTYCAARCLQLKKVLAGLLNGRACYCGSAIYVEAIKATAGGCGNPCSGNSKEFCGDTTCMLVIRAMPESTVP